MKMKPAAFWFILALLVLATVVPLNLQAQCYLSQGCKPVDNLTYTPNGTGQVYHGDGASNNGAGGWTTNSADVNQCLSCHYGTDTLPYLMTGHKNTMRKMAPGVLWSGPDGMAYPSTDAHYASGSTYDWVNGQVTLGWCMPLWTVSENGLAAEDPNCQYSYYTLTNANAPASYTTVPQTTVGGGVRTVYYVKGGWMHYGGADNLAATEFSTVFDTGFTGELYPNGNFDCARCHATGYNFDHWGPEPTSNTNSKVAWISDAHFRRVPTDGYVAPGTSGTSSWYLTGVQCERCHVAATGSGSHPWNNITVTVPRNETATALCMECHRQENVTIVNPSQNQPGNISPVNSLQTSDAGFCDDQSGSPYAACMAGEHDWIYKPFIDHEQGQAFLNSPHARFTGTLIQNAQHSPDLSITIAGTYASQFSEAPNDPTKNSGCTGCHDPHQSTVTAANGKPIVTTCDKCHRLSQTILKTTIHPAGPGTPFPTGTSADIPGACVTCHMQAALGQPESHLFRISADASYRTFPTADQLYNQGVTGLGLAPELSRLDGTIYNGASWLDVDLACGQCHVGGDGKTNPYGLTMPLGMPGAHAYTRAQLAQWAAVMHSPDPAVPAPVFSPAPTTYTTPQVISISESMKGATIYYTMDGSMPTTSSQVYTTPISISATTTFKAIATYPGWPRSNVTLAFYSIVLPTAPSPLLSPPPSTYSSSQSVTLSNAANLPMYYTTDGSTPTTQSTPYSGAISVTRNTTIKAITAAYGYQTSAVVTGNYFIQAPNPTFSPGSGTYSAAQNVTISDAVSGAIIYYTTDGSIPTTSSTPCAGPCALTISKTTSVKAVASGGGYASSNVAFATYTFAAANPTFAPGPNTFYGPVTVTMTDTTPGVVIYYSTTGFPTTSSPSCSSPCQITISATTTLRAMAAGSGISQSGTTVGVYTIAANTPTFSPASGSYAAPLNVTISETTSGATIYYSTSGFPTTSSPSCTSPCQITISATATIRAMATGNGLSQSGTGVATYNLH